MYSEQLKVGLEKINEIPPAPFKGGSYSVLKKPFIGVIKVCSLNPDLFLLRERFPFLRERYSASKKTPHYAAKLFSFVGSNLIFSRNGSSLLRDSLFQNEFPLLRGVGGLKNNLTKIKVTGLITLLFFCATSFAQKDTLNPTRLKTVIGLESVGYVGAMSGMYALWYKDVPSSSFHTFNDNAEWLQMDKIGHGMTSYYVGKGGYEVLKWSGVSKKKSIWLGGTLGLFFLTSVEVFDGYSKKWGFSWGDVAVNTGGSLFFIGQQLVWNEQRILLKYSYHKTSYANLRPELLGENLLQNALKDYNGQTYWASANIASFLGESTKFPKWLNVAVGYGADGMVGAFDNSFDPTIIRQRQYYLSLDIDLTRIKTKSKFANTILGAFGFIKFPLPTVEFNQNGQTKFYGVYF